MKIYETGQGTRPGRRGVVLLAAVLSVTVVAGMAALLMTVEVAHQQEVEAEGDAVRSLFLAECGVSEAVLSIQTALNAGVAVAPGALGSESTPLTMHGGEYWADLATDGGGTWTLTATGKSGRVRRTVEVVALVAGGGIYDNAVFAGNTSGDPGYSLELGGTGVQADWINGDIYSAGDVAINEDAGVNGQIRAKGSVYGAPGVTGIVQFPPDIASMSYATNNDVDVAAEFAALESLQSDDAGGTAWQVPETSPAHIFRKNPDDRSKECQSTPQKDDYFLEDPYEPLAVDKNQNGSDAYHITTTDSQGPDAQKWANAVYYVDGNLWLHNKKSYSFKFYTSQDVSTRVTFVVRGNVYFSDNLFYLNKNKDGVAFIAIEDPQVPDSGNVYFGDPVYGTLKEMNAFMYAENDFHDYSLDATGSAQVHLFGNMTAGNQVDIQRDFQGQHSRLTVDFDDRVATGALDMPGLPPTPLGQGGVQIVSWRRLPTP